MSSGANPGGGCGGFTAVATFVLIIVAVIVIVLIRAQS